ncbi:MAG: hypothetical protein KUG81_06405, partial [Gammaproteobacteria bacterium]|nr:hypothetical protein [Gammaproteobacteria bacterium]
IRDSGSDTIALLYADVTNPISDGYEIDLAEQTFTNVFGTYQFTSIENALGSENDDVLIGSSQNNILGGGAGDDVLNGGAGDDTYSISGSTDAFGNLLLSGNDIITDTSGDDTIELTEISSINSITITELGDDLKINMAGGSSVTVQGQLSGGSSQAEYLKLSDGTIYDLINYTNWYTGGGGGNNDPAPIVATSAVDFIIGTPTTIDTADFGNSTSGVNVNLITSSGSGGYAEGDILVFINNILGSSFGDTLTGDATNNTLTGGAGDDVLNGGAGDDTYVFNLGDGTNTITDISGFDVIQLGAGITAGDITYTQIGNDLDIQIASGFLVKDFYLGGDTIEQINFDDGTSFDLTTLLPPPSIDFNAYTISGYGGAQNESDTYVVQDSGATLNLSANTWEKIDFAYTVTADTILEFDFKSNSKGDVHGIGFVDNNSLNASQTFRVFGTQDFGINNMDTYNDNQGDWVHYTIDVGG